MSNLFEPKSDEEIKEIGKDLADFGAGYQQPKPVMAKDMTLRDYFAGQIMSSILGSIIMIAENDSFVLTENDSFEAYSFQAFAFADAMIKERNHG